MIYAAILAGGSGSRVTGSPVPKQFLDIGDMPLLVRTVKTFYHAPVIDHIVIAVAADWLDFAEDILVRAFGETDRISVTAGGSNRLNSLIQACAFLADRFSVTEDDIILTHDAARPFVSQRIIAENIDMLQDYDGVTTAYPAVDTILSSKDGKTVTEIPRRQTMYSVQTPQTFRLAALIKEMTSLTDKEKLILTDAAKIYLLREKSVGIVMGDSKNIKVTTAEDFAVAAALLQTK